MTYTTKMNSVEQRNRTRMIIQDIPEGTVIDGEIVSTDIVQHVSKSVRQDEYDEWEKEDKAKKEFDKQCAREANDNEQVRWELEQRGGRFNHREHNTQTIQGIIVGVGGAIVVLLILFWKLGILAQIAAL